jgi:hypothetical protein
MHHPKKDLAFIGDFFVEKCPNCRKLTKRKLPQN